MPERSATSWSAFPTNILLNLEAICSGTALVSKFKKRVAESSDGSPNRSCRGSIDDITGGMIAEAALKGDKLALSTFKEIGYWLGVGLATIANIFNPEMIILGGGMADTSELFVEDAAGS